MKIGIKTILSLCLAGVMLALCGCGLVAPAEDYDRSAVTELREARHTYLTLWSWQVTSPEEARAYAQKAKDCGFTAIDFAVLWSAFEPLRGHFDWTYLDGVVAIFAEAGLKVSLQPLLWTKDLSWAQELALQETESQRVYQVEGRGAFLSFTDADTLQIVENTLQNFALHVARTHGRNLTRWGVRLSCFGEFDYSVNEELDYSESAVRGFYDALKETYGSWQKLSDARGLLVASRTDLEALPVKDVVKACYGDWRRFRQNCLSDFLEMMVNVYRSADPSVPILFSLGTYGNGMNLAYSGVVDLWSLVEEHELDVVGISLCDGADEGMMLSLLSSLTTKKIAVEVDGAWALEEGRDVVSQVSLCGKHGVFSLSTANFTLEQLDAHKETLASYSQRFSSDDSASEHQPLGDRDPTRAILILSNGLAELNPPRSFDSLYGEVWATLSEQGTRRVRFVTEEQIVSGGVSLEGVTTLYTGDLKGPVPVSRAFAEAISKTDAQIKGSVSFVFLDGTTPEGDLKSALEARITAE